MQRWTYFRGAEIVLRCGPRPRFGPNTAVRRTVRQIWRVRSVRRASAGRAMSGALDVAVRRRARPGRPARPGPVVVGLTAGGRPAWSSRRRILAALARSPSALQDRRRRNLPTDGQHGRAILDITVPLERPLLQLLLLL